MKQIQNLQTRRKKRTKENLNGSRVYCWPVLRSCTVGLMSKIARTSIVDQFVLCLQSPGVPSAVQLWQLQCCRRQDISISSARPMGTGESPLKMQIIKNLLVRAGWVDTC